MTGSAQNSFWYLWFKAVGDRRGYFLHSGLVRTCCCPSAGYDLHTPRNMIVPALFESYHLFRFGEELQLYENYLRLLLVVICATVSMMYQSS